MEEVTLYLHCFKISEFTASHLFAMLCDDLVLYYKTQGINDKDFWA